MKSFKTALIAVAACAAFAGSAAHAVTTITFDAGDPIGGLAAGSTLGSQYAAFGVVFSANAFSGPGGPTGDWATNTNMTIASSTPAVPALGAPALVSGNLLHSFDDYLNENGDPSILATFASPIDFFSADFAGVRTAGSVRLFAYHDTTLLGTVTASTLGQLTLSYSSPLGITRIALTPGDYDDWAGVDNISFNLAPVPEPSTYALMLTGLAATFLLRRRQAVR